VCAPRISSFRFFGVGNVNTTHFVYNFSLSDFSFLFLFAFQLAAQHFRWPRNFPIYVFSFRLQFVYLFVSLFAVPGIYL